MMSNEFVGLLLFCWILKVFMCFNVFVYCFSGGWFMVKLGGDFICFVIMIGVKSGKWCMILLMYVFYEDGVLFVVL